jgi:hypothetical protein
MAIHILEFDQDQKVEDVITNRGLLQAPSDNPKEIQYFPAEELYTAFYPHKNSKKAFASRQYRDFKKEMMSDEKFYKTNLNGRRGNHVRSVY